MKLFLIISLFAAAVICIASFLKDVQLGFINLPLVVGIVVLVILNWKNV